jgi:hypothetical protein
VATIESSDRKGTEMADQPPTPSGSRREPDRTAADATEAEAPTPRAPEPAPGAVWPPPYDATAAAETAPPDGPAGAARRAQLRGRAILAGAATALTLGGGLVGFVVGHSTAGGNDLRPADFSRQFGDGQFGDGQQGRPRFGDRNGDGNGGGNGPGGRLGQQQPGSDGTSGSSSSSASGTST